MELNVKTRTILGKKVKSLRNEGLIPAELFGKKIKNMHLSLSEKEFAKVYKEAGENTVVNVATEDGGKIPVLISSVVKHPLSGEILAVDLYGVRMDEKIKAKIPVEFTGIAPAIKNGFLVVKVTDEIEVEALPGKIPHKFEVNLELLETPGESIYVKDIKSPEEVKIISPKETVIATVTERAEEKEEEAVSPPPAPAVPESEEAKGPQTKTAAADETPTN